MMVDDEPIMPSHGAATKKRAIRLLDNAEKIASKLPTGDDIAFTHAILCQVGLPRSAVEGYQFTRRSGAAWMNIQAGMLDEGSGPVMQCIPYGPLPRLALAQVSTYAKRYKTREIPIGDSAAEFLRNLGMDTQGSRYDKLREQMHALAACRLQLGFMGQTFNGQPVEQFDAWTSNKETCSRALWPGVMRLSNTFYGELLEHGVPLDYRALSALKGSALALDVYTWLAHRLYRIEGRPQTLYWKPIRDQFAQEYVGKNDNKDFKRKFLVALNDVLTVYSKAKVRQVNGGLMLCPSPPPVPFRDN